MSSIRLAGRLAARAVWVSSLRAAPVRIAAPVASLPWRSYSDKPVVEKKDFVGYSPKQSEMSDDQFDDMWEAYFNREDIDSWELKKGINDLYGHDLVPEPRLVRAMLKAARRLNDLPLAIRILEAVKQKGGGDEQIYSYILSEVRPTLEELGLKTPEELGIA